MKKKTIYLLLTVLVLTTCTSSGPSQEEYRAMQERLNQLERQQQQQQRQQSTPQTTTAQQTQARITVRQFNAGITRQDDNYIYSSVNGQNYVVSKSLRRDYQTWVNSVLQNAEVEGEFEYTVQNGNVTITGYTGRLRNMVIPPTINGQPVVAIGNNAFSLYNPNVLLNVSDYGITSVTIPNNVRTIGQSAFANNKQLTSVIIPNGVTTIGMNAFTSCGLTSITIPNSVTTIDQSAFGYNQLTTVTIPDSVTTIRAYAFSGNNLTSVYIGNGLTSNIPTAFAVNSGYTLTAINVASGNPVYSSVDGVVYNKARTTLIRWPPAKTPINIPSSVTAINVYAFGGNQISSITIPNSVTVIGAGIEAGEEEYQYTFYVNRLTSITIGANVTINGNAFQDNAFQDGGSSNGFKEAYNNGSRRAGTYTRPDTSSRTWTRQ
jgi:hypothetical protein